MVALLSQTRLFAGASLQGQLGLDTQRVLDSRRQASAGADPGSSPGDSCVLLMGPLLLGMMADFCLDLSGWPASGPQLSPPL